MATRLVAPLLLVLFAWVLLRTAWLCDDAYITLRTVSNFLAGYGLRFNVAERVQAYTHPLWLLCITPFHAVLRDGYFDLLLPSLLTSLLAVGLLLFRWARGMSGRILIGALLLGSRAFVEYSTAGLENPLSHLLLVLLALSLRSNAAGRWSVLLTSLALLTRPDLALFFLPPLAFWIWEVRDERRQRDGLRRASAWGVAPLLAWGLFALVYYGSLLPNTAPAKLASGAPAGELLHQGARYFQNSIRHDPLTLITIGAALFATAWRLARHTRSRADAVERGLTLGMMLHLIFVLRIGGDFMSGRFFSVPFFAALILLARVEWPERLRSGIAGAGVLGLLLVTLLVPGAPLASGPAFGKDRAAVVDDAGISDERVWYFRSTGLWVKVAPRLRPGPPFDYIGRAACRTGLRLLPEGAIGVTGYLAGPGLYIADPFALADPLLARLPMAETDVEYPEFRRALGLPPTHDGWRIGHLRRNFPAGYLRSLLSGHNEIEDPSIHRLYDDVRLVTRAPLMAEERWRAIVRLGLGAGLSRLRPAGAPTPLAEILAVDPNAAEIHFRLAESAFRRGDLEQTERELEATVASDSLDTRAAHLLLSLLAQRGEADRAAALRARLRRAASGVPGSP
ncbi:MAG: hypothetical protein U0527_01485 [Candidatus Eisenbacteria bacterium]